jgi:hypothetical protein
VHKDDIGGIPKGNIFIEVALIIEKKRHIRNPFGFPSIDRITTRTGQFFYFFWDIPAICIDIFL